MTELKVNVGDKLLYNYGYSCNSVEKIVTVTKGGVNYDNS